ncbi:hypothetical protein ACB092_10G183200 [Castanea dentata]
MSSQTPPSNPTTNPYQYLQIVNNSNGTITRHHKIPNTPTSPNPNHPTPHRFPTAYDDAVEKVHLIKNNQDEWLTKYADFSNTFIMGNSAGGNVAYHARLRIIIEGLILHQPFFGGTQRTESELRLVNDPVLPLFVNDLMWELSLPIGVDRDHEYCNPTVGGGSQRLEKIRLLGWRVLVIDCKGDPLIDRQIELVKMMEEKGLVVSSHFDEGGHHGVDLQDLSRAKALHGVLKNFMLPTLVV